IDQLLADGTFMDLMRVYADGSSENGYLLADRTVNEGEMAAEASLGADGTWTVTFSRPLAGGAGDVALEAGQTYTVGFAIHDDYSDARFHHVTLNLTLGLDNAEALINVVSQ
ncbi:MAG: cytochrome C552, partial [Shimia sp.]|nr:cytochrome C552 [Shimia sp.]